MSGVNGLLSPDELAPIAGGELRRDAAAAFNAMNVEARSRGLELRPTGARSSYRTLAQQRELWNLYTSGRGNLAARPGTSNHGLGLAVDLATPEMRKLVDEVGAKYGYAKAWSDAPGEWWHLTYRPGVWSGPDPGSDGHAAAVAIPKEKEGTMALAVATMKDGRFEVFVEVASGPHQGEVFHAWQAKEGGWAGAKPGSNAAWYSLGKPGGGK
jgi:hypothetical protein